MGRRSGKGRLKTNQTRAGRIREVSRIPKIHCLVRSRSSRMESVIGFNKIRGIGEFISHDPFVLFIGKSFPGYEVFKFSSTFSRSENFFNLLFFYSVNDIRRWWRRDFLGMKLCCMVRVEKAFMEDQMDSMPLGI